MKNTKKLILLLVLSIFLVGMLMGAATATYNVKVGKYKGTISDKSYKKLKNAKSKNKYCSVTVKPNNKKYDMEVFYNSFSGYEPMSGITFKKGYLGSVWKKGEESPIIAYKKATISPAKTTVKKNPVSTKGHTYKLGKYKVTVTDKQYKQLKNAKKKDDNIELSIKNNIYKTYKIPKYKTVKKKVWVYKNVLYYKDVWNNDWSESSCKYYNTDKYYKNGWTYCGSKAVTEKNGHVHKTYIKFKKKVTKNVKVKNGYKTVKAHAHCLLYSLDYYYLYTDYGDISYGYVNI